MENRVDVIGNFETTVDDFKSVVALPIPGKDALLAQMHQDAQAAAFIRCVAVIYKIVKDMICLHKQTDDSMMNPNEMTEYMKTELNLIDEDQAEILNYFHDLAAFLGMCNRVEDEKELNEVMAGMPDICETLTLMVEDFKGEV